MTQDLPRDCDVKVDTDDRNVTLLLHQGSASKQRSPEEVRAILGSNSETVKVQVLSELQLLSQTLNF